MFSPSRSSKGRLENTSSGCVFHDDSSKVDKKKKSILKIFSTKKQQECDSLGKKEEEIDFVNELVPPKIGKCFSERKTKSRIESLNLSHPPFRNHVTHIQEYKVFVGTWNVGGRSPNASLNLEDFLQIEGSSDIYVLGFQEIVPLNAGNVLVIEDNEPASKWLALISQALNKNNLNQEDVNNEEIPERNTCMKDSKSGSGLMFFQKPSLKVLSKNYTVESSHVKNCNCMDDGGINNDEGLQSRQQQHQWRVESPSDEETLEPSSTSRNQMNYLLISSKQMVGIFLSVWVRSELVQHVGHLRTSTVGRGIMGYLGNKGCISMSMSLHKTSFCFVCSHLASGEKEGDELKRNMDVAEILKTTQFPTVCKSKNNQIPEKILDHDRIIWLGDLNYRISLSYEKTTGLLEDNNWDMILEKDQLIIEKEAGRVFQGWKEGKIAFAPTYKYSQNSDSYAGETIKSKKKRRTPAWCDRVLWYGEGIEQFSYVRGESRFSDHRPVCAVFALQTELQYSRIQCSKCYSGARVQSTCRHTPEA